MSGQGFEGSGGATETGGAYLVFHFTGEALENLHTARTLVGVEVEGAINDLLEFMRETGEI